MTLERKITRLSLFNMLVTLKITEVLNSKAIAETRVTDENRHELERVEKELQKVEDSLSDVTKEPVINALNEIVEMARKNNISEEDIEKDLSQFKIIANSLLEEKFF